MCVLCACYVGARWVLCAWYMRAMSWTTFFHPLKNLVRVTLGWFIALSRRRFVFAASRLRFLSWFWTVPSDVGENLKTQAVSLGSWKYAPVSSASSVASSWVFRNICLGSRADVIYPRIRVRLDNQILVLQEYGLRSCNLNRGPQTSPRSWT